MVMPETRLATLPRIPFGQCRAARHTAWLTTTFAKRERNTHKYQILKFRACCSFVLQRAPDGTQMKP